MKIKSILLASASVFSTLVVVLLLCFAMDNVATHAQVVDGTAAADDTAATATPTPISTPTDLQANPSVERAPWDVMPTPEETVTAAAVEGDGIPPLSTGTLLSSEAYSQLINSAAQDSERVHAGGLADGPTIVIWYGDTQRFGHLGKPLQWVNILGNIAGPNSIISLTYTLNGGTAQPLSMGPDKRRLARQGDFNVEIDYNDLLAGDNTVVITGVDSLDNQAVYTVTVDYTPGVTWSPTTTVNWDTGAEIEDNAQVVDGKWALEGATVRPLELAYDRMIAIGDITWTDYEVVVPVTIHGIDQEGFKSPSNGPGVGLMLRWQGHFNEGGEQPNTGWKNLGALGWFRWSKDINGAAIAGLQMIGYNSSEITTNPNKHAAAGVTYIMKMSVSSANTGTPYFRYKVWEMGQPEPLKWDMQGGGNRNGPASGSMLLVAHHVDASFGQVTVRPLSSIMSNLQVATVGNGSVTVSPLKNQYAYGENVTLTAVGDTGHRLASWSGDATGNELQIQFSITQDTAVTATFVSATDLPEVTTATPVHGRIEVSPTSSEYLYGQTISFIAVPEPGYMLDTWSGDLSGKTNPLQVTIDGDIVADASFVAATAPFSDDFNRCALDTSLWTFRDPVGDVTLSMTGKQLQIVIPGGTDHDLWTDKNFAPRLLQPTDNVDFTVEAKFESGLDAEYQMQGVIIEQDTDNLLRFEFYHDGTDLHVYAASIISGTGSARLNQIVTPSGSDMYLRVAREGDTWTEFYSFDGINWNISGVFTQAITATAVGIHAGNAGTLPAHTAIVDYFYNTAAPIVPEDARDSTLRTNIVGQGQVGIEPEQAIYACGDSLTLTATPAEGWNFAGWSGALSGATTPATLSFDVGTVVTATFTSDQAPEYTLTVNALNGTVNVSPQKATYQPGETVKLTAVANEGFAFSNWSGDVTGTANPIDFTITENSVVTATFTTVESGMKIFLPIVAKGQ